jgi:TolB protein
MMNADGTHATRLTNDPGGDLFPSWSPDGTRIAFHRTQPGDPNDCIPNCVVDVYAMSADGSGVAQLTSSGSSSHPDWSPDGRLIAYVHNDGNAPGVYVMAPDGSGQRDLTPDTTQFETQPAWSPDWTMLAYAGGGEGGFDLALMNADGSGKRRVATVFGNDSFPDWQPRFWGDVSCRDKTNSVDAAIVLQLDARLLDELPCPDLADVNGEGRIDALDAALILQLEARLIDSLTTA